MSLLIVGTLAFDRIETPFGIAEKVIGGSATYFSWAASYFTNEIQLISIIGGDWPEGELRALEDRGVDLSGVQIEKDQKSFFWAGKYTDNLNTRTTLTTELNVLDDLDPNLPEHYTHADYVMLGNLTPEIQSKVISQMRHRPKIIALDTMNFWMDVAWDSLLETLKKVDILIINDEEARQLSGEYSLIKAAQLIFELGPKYLLIKKGENGALLFHQEEIFFAPALPLIEVTDPTGAGDTFAGGFLGYLSQFDKIDFQIMKSAVIYGSAMASFCVEAFSLDRLKTLDERAISDRIAQFKELIQVDL